MRPSVGRVVHYVSYGTPGGEYQQECRAAVVTAVDEGDDNPLSWKQRPPSVSLAVLSPEGAFFNRFVMHDEDKQRGGTWHWPERVEEQPS